MLTFVKNQLGQVSLVAAEPFKEGEVVFDLDMGEVHDAANLRTIELAPDYHIDHPWGRYTNHHCEPTCYVDKVKRVMRARRDIQIGEEINFNYLLNETSISSGFDCSCGAATCVGYVGSETSTPSYL